MQVLPLVHPDQAAVVVVRVTHSGPVKDRKTGLPGVAKLCRAMPGWPLGDSPAVPWHGAGTACIQCAAAEPCGAMRSHVQSYSPTSCNLRSTDASLS